MFTTSRTRKALVAVSGTALTLSMLAACGAESTADSPGTGPEQQAETQTDPDYDGDPWEDRLQKLEDYERKQNQPPYVGDPWEQRLRNQAR